MTNGQRATMREIESIGAANGCALFTYPADPHGDCVHVSVSLSVAPDGTPLPTVVIEALSDAGYIESDCRGFSMWTRRRQS